MWSLVSHLSLYAVLLVACAMSGSTTPRWAGPSPGRVRLRPAGHPPSRSPPVGLGWSRGLIGGLIGAGGDELAGGRRGADLPGAHLGAADLGRHRLLCVVATPGMDDPGPGPPARGQRTPMAATTADQCFRLRQPGPPRSQRPAQAGCRRGHGPHPGPSRERPRWPGRSRPRQHVQRVVRPKYTRRPCSGSPAHATTVQRRGTGASRPAM